MNHHNSAPGGWAYSLADQITDELFRLGDEPGCRTRRIEFRGPREGFPWTGDRETEKALGGLCQIALTYWLAKALDRHLDCIDESHAKRQEGEE